MDFQSRFKMPSWASTAWLGPSKLDQILFCYPGILWKLSVQPGSCLHGTQSPSPAEEEAITQMKWERKPNSPSCLYAQALVLTFKVNRRSSPILLSVELISIFLPRVKEEGVWKAGEGYLGCTFVCHPHTPSPDTRDRGKAAVWWAVWSSHSRSMAGEKVGEDSLPCHSSDTSIHFSGCRRPSLGKNYHHLYLSTRFALTLWRGGILGQFPHFLLQGGSGCF